MLFYDNLTEYIQGRRAKLDALQHANLPERAVISQVYSAKADAIVSQPVDELEVDHEGLLGDRHRGRYRPTNGRERSIYPKGVAIRQHRHLCVVSRHDCAVISDRMGVLVTPELVGANLVLDRCDGQDFSLSALPPETHLLVIPADAKEVPRPPIATLVRYVQQQGCGTTGKAIADYYNDRSLVKAFREHSIDRRGLICSVEFPADCTAWLRAGQQVAFRFSQSVVL